MVGVDGRAGWTTAVGVDVAAVEPPPLEAVTDTRNVEFTFAATGV